MKLCFADIETFSAVPIKAGTWAYAEGAEVMVWAYAFDDGAVRVWDATAGAPMPDDLAAALADPEVEFVFHNGGMFDTVVLRVAQGIDLPLERVHDTLAHAMAHALPGALGKLCDILDVPTDQAKDKRGKDLIRLFCCPRPKGSLLRRATSATHPKEWAEFLEYAAADITAMRAVYRRLPRWNFTGFERELWALDQRINRRGVAIDMDLARAAISATDSEKARLKTETVEATDGLVSGPSKRDDLLAFILAEYGVDLPDMKADTLRRRLEDPELPDGVKLLLSIRLEATKTSTAKYQAFLSSTSTDNRLRGTMQFCGASRTGRWSGRLVQLQNLKRPDMPAEEIGEGIEALKAGCADLFFADTMNLCANAVRGAIVAPPGKKLVIADLANIEGRGLAFLAGEAWKLQAFREYDAGTGPDLYVAAYARSFGVKHSAVGKNERQIGKVQELGLGYEGGVAAFITFAAVYRMDLEELADAVHRSADKGSLAAGYSMYEWAEKKHRTLGLPRSVYVACEVLKRAWRDAHPATTALWKAAGDGVKAAIANPGVTFDIGQHLKARRDGAWLRIRLPSGRYLCYLQPKVEDEQVSYMGVNMYTRQWGRIKTYGGKLIENCIAEGTEVLTEAGWKPIESVEINEAVWDGVEWVAHKGCVYSGKQHTMQVFGVNMTSDHEVLTTGGWRRASSCEGLDRYACRLPHCNQVLGERRNQVAVGCALRLRKDDRAGGHGAGKTKTAGSDGLVRLHAPGDDRSQTHHARDVKTSCVCGLAERARPLRVAFASVLGELRRAGYHRLREMARGVREFLGRHGANLPARVDFGAEEQQPGVFQTELRVGVVQAAGGEHPSGAHDRDAGRGNASRRCCRHLRGEAIDAGLPARPQLAGAESARRVYDLIDCGPRRRFVVRGADGLPLIVHNCTQAFARDVMAHNMPHIDGAGYPIVLSVHDELLTEPDDAHEFNATELSALMSRVPPWAKGLPLAAAGFETYRYRKE